MIEGVKAPNRLKSNNEKSTEIPNCITKARSFPNLRIVRVLTTSKLEVFNVCHKGRDR